MEPMLFTVPEVAEIIKCNVNKVHELRKAGVLPFLKLGQYKCRREALEEFLRKYEGFDVTDPLNIVPLMEQQSCLVEEMRSISPEEHNEEKKEAI